LQKRRLELPHSIAFPIVLRLPAQRAR